MALTFPKSEKIASALEIAELTKTGKWMGADVLKMCFRKVAPGEGRMAVSVPKKLFKRAVKRNLLKRRIREAYRHLKGETPSADILFVYSNAEVAPYEVIYAQMEHLLKKIR